MFVANLGKIFGERDIFLGKGEWNADKTDWTNRNGFFSLQKFSTNWFDS